MGVASAVDRQARDVLKAILRIAYCVTGCHEIRSTQYVLFHHESILKIGDEESLAFRDHLVAFGFKLPLERQDSTRIFRIQFTAGFEGSPVWCDLFLAIGRV